jgi:hypothetical protein
MSAVNFGSPYTLIAKAPIRAYGISFSVKLSATILRTLGSFGETKLAPFHRKYQLRHKLNGSNDHAIAKAGFIVNSNFLSWD